MLTWNYENQNVLTHLILINRKWSQIFPKTILFLTWNKNMIENQHNNHWGSQDTQPGGGGGDPTRGYANKFSKSWGKLNKYFRN